MRVVPGEGTTAPSFVTGIRETPRPGTAEGAARAHIADNASLYGIDGGELTVLQEIAEPGSTTVRFGQAVSGIPVLGAQYLVHMRRDRLGHSVEAVNGHVFTRLEAAGTPKISASDALLMARTYVRPMKVLRVVDRGLVILPRGRGQLVFRFGLWGTRFGLPASYDVFVDARTGAIAGALDGHRYDGPVVGSGETAHGATVDLNAFLRGSTYELRDRARAMWTTDGGEIRTHDVSGSQGFAPTSTNLVKSPSSFFQNEATNSGAVDAHWGAGQTFEFFAALGRNSIDDEGMSIISSVDAADPDFGGPMYNAFWDSVTNQMVYGNPDRQQLYPISADLDIVGHELTHGVTQYTADLLYIYQSGAMNEAYSDYFGNAIDVTVSGTSMSAPEAGFVGEDICRVPNPAVWGPCPLRDLNDGATVADFGYYLPDLDSGGVHLNSSLFGGALWDIRETLGSDADVYVYKALAEYQTPLDDFVDGRNAIVAAAEALGASPAHLNAITHAFDAKGIVDGWESTATTTDSTVLVSDVTAMTELCPISGGQPRISGQRFVFADYTSDSDICTRSADVYAGSLAGGSPVRVGSAGSFVGFPNGTPDIAGRRVVWTQTRALRGNNFDVDVRSKVIGGGSKTLAGGTGIQWFPAIDGKLLVWENFTDRTGTNIKARTVSGKTFTVSAKRTEEYLPQVEGKWIAWWDQGNGSAAPTIRAKNIRTGARMKVQAAPGVQFVGPPALGGGHIVWYQDDDLDGDGAILAVPLGGSQIKQLAGPNDAAAPTWDPASFFYAMPAVNDGHVVYAGDQRSGATEFGRDLFIVPLSGGTPVPVTENRGDQAHPALASGRQVLWLDASLGRADLVTRVVP